MRLLPRLSLLLALCLPVAAAAAPCPQPLRIAFIDTPVPPLLFGSGTGVEDPPGWAVQAVREAAQRLGCTAELLRQPGRRVLRRLELGDLELALFFGPTPERMRSMSFPLDAAGRPDAAWAPGFGHLALYALPGNPALKAWSGGTLPAGVRVGVVSGSTQEALARQRGWTVEGASGYDSSVAALRAHRFELLLMPRESLPAGQLSGEDALVELAPLVERLPYFAPASRKVQAAHAEFITEFWHELCKQTRRLAPEARGADCGVRPR
jgi:ABC-type amino acid transport substrate-binding protein